MTKQKENFDNYADNYNEILQDQLSFFNKDVNYFARYKIKLLHRLINKPELNILDYGCGVGRSVPYIKEFYPSAKVSGFDISEDSIKTARENNPNATFYTSINAAHDKKFDIIIMTCVVHHITELERNDVFEQIKNMLSSNGKLVIFEHNPYNPLTLKLVNECPFDADAELINRKKLHKKLSSLGFKKSKSFYTLFFPAFLKKLMFLERFLSWLPLGGQYIYIAEKSN